MKQCPTCRQTFDDDTLSFCLSDGSHLVPVESTSSNSAPTIMATFPPEHQTAAQTPPRETTPNDWNSQNQDWPNLALPQPAPVQTKRSPLPWILGIVALLVIGGGVLYFALSSRSSSSSVASSNSNSNSSANANSNTNANSNAHHNANENNSNNENDSNANSNSNANSDGDDSPPTNRNEVLADLSRLEDQWNTANMTGDKETLDDVLADDFDSSSGDKKQYIANIKPDSNVLSETISDLELTLDGKKATLRGINTIRYRKGDPAAYRFADSFVWRDGRWQAVGAFTD